MFSVGKGQRKKGESDRQGVECTCYGKHIMSKTCHTEWNSDYNLHRIVDAAEKVSFLFDKHTLSLILMHTWHNLSFLLAKIHFP